MNRYLLVTDAGSSGSTWHVFEQGEEECICGRHSHPDVNRNTPKKKVGEEKLLNLLKEDSTPGLGDWAGKCRRQALEIITGEKQFSCEICGKGLSNSAGVIAHVRGVHEKSSEEAREMAAKGDV